MLYKRTGIHLCGHGHVQLTGRTCEMPLGMMGIDEDESLCAAGCEVAALWNA